MTRIRKHLTPALGIALVALFVALGGISYAAVSIPRNSVGKAQIRSEALYPRHLSATLISRLAFADQLHDIPLAGTLIEKRSVALPETETTVEALCPSGMLATSGGASYFGLVPQASYVNATGNGWVAIVRETEGAQNKSILVRVVCTKGATSSPVAAVARR